MYRLAIPLPLKVLLVSRESFDNEEQATAYAVNYYADYPNMIVINEEKLVSISQRVVIFPEKIGT